MRASEPPPNIDPQFAIERPFESKAAYSDYYKQTQGRSFFAENAKEQRNTYSSAPNPPPKVDPRFAKERVSPVGTTEASEFDFTSHTGQVPPRVGPRFAKERVRPVKVRKSTQGLKQIEGLSDDALWKYFVKTVDPYELEKIILEAYQNCGYQVRPTPKSVDDGLDGVIFRDGDAIGIQVKRWKGNVGGPEMRDFLGALTYCRLTKGHFLTTGKLSKKARQYTGDGRIEVVAGEHLRIFLLDHARERVIAVSRR